MQLEGRKILVTGAGQGIGRGIAQAVSEAGGDVALIDLRMEALQETARAVEKSGRAALCLVADVTDERAVRGAIDRMVAEFGRIDGLVNNAGVIEMSPALDIGGDSWDKQFAVNVRGLVQCCQSVVRRMIDAGTRGTIVNIASNAGKVGYPNMAAYNASKAAVINLTRTLSAEWAEHGINVNAVCPGGVDTPMLGGVAEWIGKRIGMDPKELLDGMKPNQMDRKIQPIEIGRVVAFLLSDTARIIRGQAINADGGDTPY